MRILVTRPEPGASLTAERLRQLGHEPIVLPLSRIVPVSPTPVPATVGFHGAILTSANAVIHMPVALHRRLSALPCYVVGKKTADLAEQHGFDVATVSANAHELAERLAIRGRQGDRLAYACGRVRKAGLEQELKKIEIDAVPIEVYDTLKVSYSTDYIVQLCEHRAVDAVLVYSAVAAEQVSELLSRETAPYNLVISKYYCISERVAREVSSAVQVQTFVAQRPDEDAVLHLLNGQ